MTNEKVTQLKEKVSEYFNNEIRNDFQLPYSRINATIEAVLENTNLRNSNIDYSLIELMKIVLFTSSILTHMEIEYELPYFEKEEDEIETTVNWYVAYDELYPIWIIVRNFGNVDELELILEREIELAEKKHLQLGMVEGQMYSLMVKATDVLDTINTVAKDEKKLIKLITTIDKKAPNVSGIIKQLMDGLPKITEIVGKFTNKEQK